MDYQKYRDMQIYGEIIKPVHYHIGEWLAINTLCNKLDRESRILDVGCGIGYGVGMFKKLGFKNVLGIDLNPDKIAVGRKLGYNIIEKDIKDFHGYSYDVIWSSHSFEHMYDPAVAIKIFKGITSINASLFFILPYPDLTPSPVHHSAPIIGTNINDGWRTVVKWFESQKLNLVFEGSCTFREPEIWLEFKKI